VGIQEKDCQGKRAFRRERGEQAASEGFGENYPGGSKGGFVFESGYIVEALISH
jgi:hypothetical protein